MLRMAEQITRRNWAPGSHTAQKTVSSTGLLLHEKHRSPMSLSHVEFSVHPSCHCGLLTPGSFFSVMPVAILPLHSGSPGEVYMPEIILPIFPANWPQVPI